MNYIYCIILIIWNGMVLSVQLNTCPGRGVGMGSGLIQFSQVFFSSLKGPFITLVISSRLYTHTADSSPLSLHITYQHNRTNTQNNNHGETKSRRRNKIQKKWIQHRRSNQVRDETEQNTTVRWICHRSVCCWGLQAGAAQWTHQSER